MAQKRIMKELKDIMNDPQLSAQQVQQEMILSTGRQPSWGLQSHHLRVVYSSSTSTFPPTTPSNPPSSPSPPVSTTQISTPTVPSAWTFCAHSGPRPSPYQRYYYLSAPCSVTPTLTTPLFLRLPGSTRLTSRSTQSVRRSGLKNMPCDFYYQIYSFCQ